MQIIADVKKIPKTAQHKLIFILNVLCKSSIHFTHFQYFLLKRLFVFSNNMVFIESEAVLLCVTMRERARLYAATI